MTTAPLNQESSSTGRKAEGKKERKQEGKTEASIARLALWTRNMRSMSGEAKNVTLTVKSEEKEREPLALLRRKPSDGALAHQPTGVLQAYWRWACARQGGGKRHVASGASWAIGDEEEIFFLSSLRQPN